MVKTTIPFYADDLSKLAKSINNQLKNYQELPSHLEIMNILAKAVGFKNYQHFKSEAENLKQDNQIVLEKDDKPALDNKTKKLMRYFNEDGQLVRWPSKHSHRLLCLWVVWSQIPKNKAFDEKEINSKLDDLHLFGDYALLRRWLCDYGFMSRNRDGSNYQRLEIKPTEDASSLLRELSVK